jgi:hypothetical protein
MALQKDVHRMRSEKPCTHSDHKSSFSSSVEDDDCYRPTEFRVSESSIGGSALHSRNVSAATSELEAMSALHAAKGDTPQSASYSLVHGATHAHAGCSINSSCADGNATNSPNNSTGVVSTANVSMASTVHLPQQAQQQASVSLPAVSVESPSAAMMQGADLRGQGINRTSMVAHVDLDSLERQPDQGGCVCVC